MRKLPPKYLLLIIGVLAVAAVFGVYRIYGSPTKVAFVNYPEYILAPMLDQPINPAIKVTPVKWTEQSGQELKNYDMIIFFGMGLNFTEEQQEILSKLKKPIYTTASTRQETALNTLTEEQLKTLRQYLSGGKENFRRMLDFIRYDINGKRLNAVRPEPPKAVKRGLFFHIDEDAMFDTFEEYITWYKGDGRFKEGASTVCLLSGNGGGALDKLIESLEKKGLNVVAANGMGRALMLLEQIKPDLVIYQPHGRLGEEAVEFLTKHNIPLFCPIKANQEYEEYLHDQRGMTGGMLSQSVTMPELDGAAVPFVLSALFRNKNGLQEFRMIPDRLERFSELVRKTCELRRKPNSEKKIAIIYYGSVGREAATAGLGISDSMLNTLRTLQKAGYTTGPLPENVEEFAREIGDNTARFGTNAGTAAEENPQRIQTATITPDNYHAWIKKSMPADLYQTVTERYGDFPGKSFRTPEGNMALGRIQFGNVILMPQSLPGEGGSESTLVHGVKMAPPHTYIATYLYIRHGFQADAMMHFGTHGSLEFTPWKQVALSSYDWPDVLVGEMPHYYLYIINNVGEALIAKRRSYATMVSHLTAPFMQADGYGALQELHEKIENYEVAETPMLKAEYVKSIIEIAKKEHYDRDLKLSEEFTAGKLTEEDLARIHNFLEEIQGAKVNRGMYVIGRPYSEEEANETARLMTVDAIADALFKADLEAGEVKEEQRKDLHFFTETYLAEAHARAKEALVNPEKFKKAPAMPASHNTDASAEDMRKIMQSGKLPDGREIPPEMAAAMQQMGAQSGNRPQGMGRGMGQRSAPKPKPEPEEITFRAKEDLLKSTEAELASILNAFSGGYLLPSPGGDPILNPDTVPTGRNLFGIDPERTPTRESYAVGKQLADALIEAKLKSTGEYPKKVAFSLWGGEFIRTQGVNIGEIFYLLGVEPMWDSRGRVQDVRLIPLSELKRPRIDVVVQTSGQFRGAATSRMRLIDKAVRLAATDPDGEFGNFVREGSLEIVKALIANGMSPEEAKSLSNARLFGGVNGNFGTGVTGMVQASGNWEDTKAIADVYLNNMGALYTEEHWGEHVQGVFKAALINTDTVVQSRSSNSWGPLSLDHVYEFTGGISLAARHVNGKDPVAYFNDLRTPGRAKIQEAGEAAMVEARSTVLNPKYLKEMMAEGPAAAGTFTEVLHNTFGWEVMKPDMLEDHLWQEYKEVFVDDKLNLEMRKYFEENSPRALQEMTAVMLEAVRKGFWEADAETVKQLAETHAEMVKKYNLQSNSVRTNEKLREMIKEQLKDPEVRKEYEQQVAKALQPRRQENTEEVTGQQLKEQTVEQPKDDEGSNRAALRVILGIIIFGLLAIILGNWRRKKTIS